MLLNLTPGLTEELGILYEDMEKAYDAVAEVLGHGCDGCPDNCCDSYFLHHTYIEWAYLWEGVAALPDKDREALLSRAKAYELEAQNYAFMLVEDSPLREGINRALLTERMQADWRAKFLEYLGE